MVLSFPRTDILTAVEFEDQSFQLSEVQEYSHSAGGVAIGKDLGPAIWIASYTTSFIANDDAVAYEADLRSLDGVINPFEAGDLRRVYPRSAPTGAFNDTGVIASVNTNNKAMALSGLDPAFVLSKGDYLSFNYGTSRALHQLMESVTANGSGATAQFEVRPHIRPGWTLSAPVRLKRPSALFTMVPKSISPKSSGSLHTVISFQATQYLL